MLRSARPTKRHKPPALNPRPPLSDPETRVIVANLVIVTFNFPGAETSTYCLTPEAANYLEFAALHIRALESVGGAQ